MAKQRAKKEGKGGSQTLEAKLFKAADLLRGSMEPSEYKHVVLGLIFLRYISYSFESRYLTLQAQEPDLVEDRDEYEAESIYFVPEVARWSFLQDNARSQDIGRAIDDAMEAVEKENPSLKGVLAKDYARLAVSPQMLGDLIDLLANVDLGVESNGAQDILGRVYEYFLGEFAGVEGKRGGEFYTPSSVVRLLVGMLEPAAGDRIYDPCCGSGGMFVQSERFVEEHGGRLGDIAIYGQESNATTWRLAKMNLAVRRIDNDIRWNSEGSFHKDEFPDERFDCILANPPFNDSEWGGQHLRTDPRWTFGAPPQGNANYAWLQHIHHHLRPDGVAGVVLANGSLTTTSGGEYEIRRQMVKGDVVDCMVALPGKLFYSTQIPACLWFLARKKNPGSGLRDRRGEVLFIDAREMGRMVDRTRCELHEDDLAKITHTYHAWRGKPGSADYADEPGFCESVRLGEIAKLDYALTPGRYISAAPTEASGSTFEEEMEGHVAKLYEQMAEAQRLDGEIRKNLEALGFIGGAAKRG